MSLTIRVLLGLAIGFLLGLAFAGSSSHVVAAIVTVLTAVGTVFVNLIRMAAIPLVLSLLVATVGSAMPGRLGQLGAQAAMISVGLLIVVASSSTFVAQRVLARVPLDRNAALALQSPASSQSAAAPSESGLATLSDWLVDLVPQNVVKAAADGAILPLIVAALLFGLALAHVDHGAREPILKVCNGIAEAMQQIVAWILRLSPIGVFALAVPLASRLGWSAATAAIAYVALVVVLTVLAVVLLLYPLGVLAGPLSLTAFVSYCAPSQAIGFASRSSLAALPAMIESAERSGLPADSAGVMLPLALMLFHIGSAVAQSVGVVFVARLFGTILTWHQTASVVVAVVLASFAVPGIPGGSIIAIVPALVVANLPLDGVGVLLAVDAIPDMFRTTANVTGALTLAAILSPPRDRQLANQATDI